MTSGARRALIAGASGLVGAQCLRLLLADDRCAAVRSLVRRPGDIAHPKLQESVVDFDRLQPSDVGDPDDVYCCLGATLKMAGSREAFRKIDYHYCLEIARLASQNGARRFALVSSVSADPNSPNFYLRVKGDLEAALATLGFETLALLRPSFLLGDRPERRRAERIGILAAKALTPLLIGPLRKYRPIEAAAVARAAVAALASGPAGARILHYDQMRP